MQRNDLKDEPWKTPRPVSWSRSPVMDFVIHVTPVLQAELSCQLVLAAGPRPLLQAGRVIGDPRPCRDVGNCYNRAYHRSLPARSRFQLIEVGCQYADLLT